MAFERKVLGELHCLRCNAIAELRAEEYKPGSEQILVYIVCKKCRLRRFHHRTTKRAIRLQAKIEKIINRLEDYPDGSYTRNRLLAIINDMEIQRRRAERF